MLSPFNTLIQTFLYRMPCFPIAYPVPHCSMIEDSTEARLAQSPYQIQFKKNLEELKSEYKTVIPHTISHVALKEYLECPFEEKIK